MTYHKNDRIWKILFPFGDCHEIKFKENDESETISLAGQNRQIKITAENASSKFEIDENYKDFLDLTAEYSHVNGVKLKNDWNQKAVLMSIENAKFSVLDYTESKHMLVKENNVTFAPSRIGYSGQASLSGERIIVQVDNHPDFPKVYENDCTLVFDNDCELGAVREISDFDMVYRIVEDAEVREDHYTVTKVADNLDFPIFAGTILDPIKNRSLRDPFARGLPCHLVRISQSEKLL